LSHARPGREVCARPGPFSRPPRRASRHRLAPAATLAAALAWACAGVAEDSAGELEQIVVIGTTPMPGSGVDIDKIPSNVQTLAARDLSRDGGPASLPGSAARRLANVTLNNEQGSQYQPDFVFRGFEASPISGIAQGLAVYANGVRVNEAFGDTVNWDLVPQFAVARMTLQSNNPVFGLNALGGAVTLEMKDGFNTRGAHLKISAGSFGNLTGYAEYAERSGDFAVYAAFGAMEDGGFRYHSPTYLHQGYVDLGYEHVDTRVHLALGAADNTIGAVGPTPVQMLTQNPNTVFTFPQAMHNTVASIELSGLHQLAAGQWLSANAYVRRFQQHLVDGNTTDVQSCANDAQFFCLEGTDRYPGDLLYDSNGHPVPTSVLPPGATPGQIDQTHTATTGSGGALQWSSQEPLRGRDQNLVIGISVDHGETLYSAQGQLGTLLPTLEVLGAAIIIDQRQSSTAQPPILEPALVRASNDYAGIYFTDTVNVTAAAAWTLSGRYNRARVVLRDLAGGSVNGDHEYQRFNPGAGLSYRFTPAVTGYVNYSEANRAPTPAELSCSNPNSPCPLDSFLVSDPALSQVVSHTMEAGLRGHFAAANVSRHVNWNVGVFRTDNRNDIILLATNVNGFGYFSNAGATRRQGLESSLSYRSDRWDVSASYSRLDAVFRDRLLLGSNSPAADAQGNISVRSGNVLPLTPRHRFTMQAEYTSTARWQAGVAVRFVSTQFLIGDQSNQAPPLPGYTVVDLDAAYPVGKALRLFAAINNLLGRSYYTYGAFTRLDGLPPNVNLTDPRTFGPSPGRTFVLGFNLALGGHVE
jgi:iron complex outermembrane recepter protein